MRHYEVGEWADFVRNLITSQKRVEMEQHQAACADCSAAVEFLNRVAVTAQAEQTYESATKSLSAAARQAFVKQRIPVRTRGYLIDALQTLVAQLTYDSAVDLQPVGARTQHPATRQMLYEAGDFCLDLRFDRALDSTQVTLVGQIVNRKEPERRFATVRVLVMAKQQVVAETASNEFGEFTLDYTPRSNLELCVPITEAGIRLEVPLQRVLEQYES